MKPVGFVGTGHIGNPVARRLQEGLSMLDEASFVAGVRKVLG